MLRLVSHRPKVVQYARHFLSIILCLRNSLIATLNGIVFLDTVDNSLLPRLALLERCASQPKPAIAPVGALDQVVSPVPKPAWRHATRTPVSSAILAWATAARAPVVFGCQKTQSTGFLFLNFAQRAPFVIPAPLGLSIIAAAIWGNIRRCRCRSENSHSRDRYSRRFAFARRQRLQTISRGRLASSTAIHSKFTGRGFAFGA
jgi:hypothetical protein